MSPADSRQFVLEYAGRLNITQQDTWLVYLARSLAGCCLRQAHFNRRYDNRDWQSFQGGVNETLRLHGVAHKFRSGPLSSPDPHPDIVSLLSAVKDAKSEREVLILHFVALWELRRSAFDLEPTEDTPYLHSEWTIGVADFVDWPSRYGLAASWQDLCESEIAAWTSDLQTLRLPNNYKNLRRHIEKLTEDELDQTCTMSASSGANQPKTILILSASPRDEVRLRIGDEQREIVQALSGTKYRANFTVTNAPACRIRDIAKALDDNEPNILLFTGHGDNHYGLVFQDDRGYAVEVDIASFARLLKKQRGLDLVIMNACYSNSQAQAMADAVGSVVGMEGKAQDQDSVEFSREFFQALGYGRTYEEAFERARDAIALNANCKLRPHFKTK